MLLEVCCGSFEDAKEAEAGGADRIELNSALYLGGLTPSMANVMQTKENCRIPVVAMVRPRGGGFCYSSEEYKTMLLEAKLLLEAGVDGIAFGFLSENGTIDTGRTKQMVELIHSYQKEAVFHRAIDCTPDIMAATGLLAELGADRILTSGGYATAPLGEEQIARMVLEYGNRIQILAGSGLRAANAVDFIRKTGISQIHSSCRCWDTDKTAATKNVSFGYAMPEHECDYEAVHNDAVRELVQKLV